MTQEGFRQLAAPIVSKLVDKGDLPEDTVVAVMEEMVEDGVLGLDKDGQLAPRKPV